jgi:hypothetical protein
LIKAYGTGKMSTGASRLKAVMALKRLRDPRVVQFLLQVLADRRAPTKVRSHLLKQLREVRSTVGHRQRVAKRILDVLSDRSNPALRLQAALTLAEFADMTGVPQALADVAQDPDKPIELRYTAFRSLQEAGPTTACVVLLRELSVDETLGSSAASCAGIVAPCLNQSHLSYQRRKESYVLAHFNVRLTDCWCKRDWRGDRLPGDRLEHIAGGRYRPDGLRVRRTRHAPTG